MTTGRAKGASWIIFLGWVTISAVANYAHGENAVAGLLMAAAPVGFAAVTFLLEMLVSKGYRLGWLSGTAMVLVATGAGVASFIGLAGLASENGVDTLVSWLLPLAFDGVVLAASLAIRYLSSPPAGQDTHSPDSTAPSDTALDVDIALDMPAQDSPVDIDLEDTLARYGIGHGMPSDADMADAMDRMADTPAPVEPPASARRLASATDPLAAAWDADEAQTFVLAGLAARVPTGQIDALLGGYYGKSAKSIQRFRADRALRPVSAPPAS